MKRPTNPNKDPINETQGKKPESAGTSVDETEGITSIQEFIELKKLQNRILGKLIEKLNTNENQFKPNNK